MELDISTIYDCRLGKRLGFAVVEIESGERLFECKFLNDAKRYLQGSVTSEPNKYSAEFYTGKRLWRLYNKVNGRAETSTVDMFGIKRLAIELSRKGLNLQLRNIEYFVNCYLLA